MRKKCGKADCTAPKGLCKNLTSPHYQACPFWNSDKEADNSPDKSSSNNKATSIPWSGLALQPDEIELFAHRSAPKIIGIIGSHKAGKTSYLGMLYTLLFNGKKFKSWNFAGSYTLIEWENLAKSLKIKRNGMVDFPEPTPSHPDFYSLYHLALRNKNSFHDVLFADSSGEVFTKWANKIDDINAENARWIYNNSHAFLLFIDCESVITERGRAKQKIALLAGQINANLDDRPLVVVWSKADRITEIRPNIKTAIDQTIERLFPAAEIIQISNFSKDDPDTLCHINNLKATEVLLDKLNDFQPIDIDLDVGQTKDFFYLYKGSYENQ